MEGGGMNKKRITLLILSFIFVPFFLTCCSYLFAEESTQSEECPKKRINVGWTFIETETKETLRGIFGESKDHVIAVGENGTIRECREITIDGCDPIMQCTPMNIRGRTAKMNLSDIHGYFRGDNIDLFAVGDGKVLQRYNSNSTRHKKGIWETIEIDIKIDRKIKDKTELKFHSVWVDFQQDAINVFAVGIEGKILRGTILPNDPEKIKWDIMPSNTDENLNGIWGFDSNDIYAVGNEGTILHWDGTEWSPKKCSTSGNLNGIWGSSPENIFAVGDGGTILQCKDGEWFEMESTASENLNAVWGRSKNDVYAVGNRGRILHYDGNKDRRWRKIPRPTIENLHGIWISENTHVFVVGENGVSPTYTYAYIYGYILDSTTGNEIAGAWVWRKDSQGIFKQMGTNPTGSSGFFDHSSDILELFETFKFTGPQGYEESEEISVDIPPQHKLDIRTYLLPSSGFQNSISGVISEEYVVTEGGIPYTFSQVVNPPPTVYLYKKDACGVYPGTPECSTSTNNGHYYFPNGNCSSLGNGTYKVVPVQNGYIFYSEYLTIDIVLPQQFPPQSYDFTRDN